jgi:ABC-type uncharacterized transport system fused permease/ATPase subunit
MELLLMFTEIAGLLLCLIFIITIISVALNIINKYIDKRFETEFYNKTNKFIRLFISENKKDELNHKNTFLYRQTAQFAANSVTKIAILVIAIFVYKAIRVHIFP